MKDLASVINPLELQKYRLGNREPKDQSADKNIDTASCRLTIKIKSSLMPESLNVLGRTRGLQSRQNAHTAVEI